MSKEKLTNAILQKENLEMVDHLTYISKKQKKTLELFDKQMIEGKIFTETTFEKLDNLKEDISDLEE